MTAELPTHHKGRYPFRLACPSFIYPAGYVDNVRRLGGCVDEIELLLLESAPECLPRRFEINELSILAQDYEMAFNIHLPTDVAPGSDKPGADDIAVDSLLRAIDLSRPLKPLSYTLHVPFPESSDNAENLTAWQHRVRESLKRLLDESGLPADLIAIETLDYPLHYLDTVIRELGFGICLDTGHLMVRGEDCRQFYQTCQQRVIIIHIHGVDNGRDHLALDRLSEARTREISHILRGFRRSVSLEVFSFDKLSASLDYLDRIWQNLSQLTDE